MAITAPNIFTYATKELSQDAFLCWLLSFACPKYKDTIFKELHLLAVDLVHAFVGDDQLVINELVIKTQEFKIDIWIEINGQILLIIEDKIDSQAGINQLSNYFKIAQNYCKANTYQQLIPVYFKTGNEAKRIFDKVYCSQKWSYFSLENLMQHLTNYKDKIDHPFFIDFYTICYNKLEMNRNFANHILFQEINNTKNATIEAFYKKLEEDNVFTNWNFLDSRGVRTYYSNQYSYHPSKPNIYIELNRLTLKFKIDLGKLGKERGKEYKKFQKELKENNIRFIYDGIRTFFEQDESIANFIEKPSRFSIHNFLTFGIVPIDRWATFKAEGGLDYEATKNNIIAINQKLEKFIDRHQQELNEIINSGFIEKI